MLRATAVLIWCVSIGACGGSGDPPAQEPLAMSELLSAADVSGFERAVKPRPFVFPRDHNSHSGFKAEWWYFTGNLTDAAAGELGYQLTFFRFALAAGDAPPGSAWHSRDAWMAHFAVTDVAGSRFVAAERLSRDGLGLAGNSPNPFRLWIEDWSATATGPNPFPLRLRAETSEAALDLTLVATKLPVANGDGGLDRKGPEPGNASHYYSMPRLATSGEIRLGDTRHRVTGSTWMDREWSSNALSPELAGWDWLALGLSDGSDLMLYRLRTRDGGASRFSSGSFVSRDGARTALTRDDFVLEPRDFWTSPASGARYPVGWRVRVPSRDLELDVRASIPDQELRLSVRYWEGAVTVSGTAGESEIEGRGYLELTGY